MSGRCFLTDRLLEWRESTGSVLQKRLYVSFRPIPVQLSLSDFVRSVLDAHALPIVYMHISAVKIVCRAV